MKKENLMEENVAVEESAAENGKTFTQEEVNAIVTKRLEKERARKTDDFSEKENELSEREKVLSCKEYLLDNGFDRSLIDIVDTSDPDLFAEKVNKIYDLFYGKYNQEKEKEKKEQNQDKERIYPGVTKNPPIKRKNDSSFSNKKHVPKKLY